MAARRVVGVQADDGPSARRALARGSEQVGEWRRRGVEVGSLWVSVRAAELRDLRVSDVAREAGGAPVVAAIEGEALADDAARAAIEGLRRRGVRVVIDDFGSRSSPLHCVTRGAADGVRIDRAIVADEPRGPHVVRAVVGLAEALGLEVVAQGVDTPEQARAMREAGCHTMQGLLFGAPATAEVSEHVLRSPSPAAPLDPAAPASPADPTVTLGDAAAALSISASTLRRWADAGRIRMTRTRGGHRRFPVSEIRRLERETVAAAPPAVRRVALPERPLPVLATLLGMGAEQLWAAGCRALYEQPSGGWFASEDGGIAVRGWGCAVADAARAGRFDAAVRATASLRDRACLASLLERHAFVERYGDIAVRALQRRGDAGGEVLPARRLFVRLAQELLETPS